MKLSQIRILTKNFQSTFNFYKNVLNLEVSWGTEEGPYASFKTDLSDIALFDQSLMLQVLQVQPDNFSNSLSSVIVLEIENVDEFYNTKKGEVKFITAPESRTEWGVRTVHLYDPEGKIIELNQNL